jgi:hypothetical protein
MSAEFAIVKPNDAWINRSSPILARRHTAHDVERLRLEVIRECFEQHDASRFGGAEHRDRFGLVGGEWFLAQHVLAGARRAITHGACKLFGSGM